MDQPVVIGVGGFTSDVGKTTLMCELLRAFPGWEAIKTTRGHYRSCGKDPQACCVSHLLSEEPLVRSGREETYDAGKDTGRYWDAGASNVHWLIATDNQIEKGIQQALARVKAPGVFIEGNSFTQYVPTDYFVMVRQAGSDKIKSTARKAMDKASAIYVTDDLASLSAVPSIPVFTPLDLQALIDGITRSLTTRV
jgi:molybdopterin-guanine dinucleotide biosynthesis protein